MLVLICKMNRFSTESVILIPLAEHLRKTGAVRELFQAFLLAWLLHISCCVTRHSGIWVCDFVICSRTSRMKRGHSKSEEISYMSDIPQTPDDLRSPSRPWTIVWKETVSLSTKGKWGRKIKRWKEMSLQIAWEADNAGTESCIVRLQVNDTISQHFHFFNCIWSCHLNKECYNN